jgi:hypothetical protein
MLFSNAQVKYSGLRKNIATYYDRLSTKKKKITSELWKGK